MSLEFVVLTFLGFSGTVRCGGLRLCWVMNWSGGFATGGEWLLTRW